MCDRLVTDRAARLAWLADYRSVAGDFRSGKDAYAQFGATMFGIPGCLRKRTGLAAVAKSALLGCFAPETRLDPEGWVHYPG